MADISREIEAQERELRAALERLPHVMREVQQAAVADAYNDIVRTSPRVTGAYRNEHVVEGGNGDGGPLLYESPNRVGPDAIVNPPTLLADPAGPGALAIGDYAVVAIANRRFYAPAVEYTYGYYVYANAAERADENTERIISERAARK